MANKFLITIIEFNETQLTQDKLAFSDVPEAIGDALDALTPAGSLDVQVLYLLTPEQKEKVRLVLEHLALPYPAIITDARGSTQPPGKVLYLHDRRQRTEEPHSPSPPR